MKHQESYIVDSGERKNSQRPHLQSFDQKILSDEDWLNFLSNSGN